jgi:hypothetical protein
MEKTWLIKYDSFLGGVSAEWEDPALAKEPLSWRAYLLRLHTAHGYMGIFEARWFWAWIVDAMSFCHGLLGIVGLYHVVANQAFANVGLDRYRFQCDSGGGVVFRRWAYELH